MQPNAPTLGALTRLRHKVEDYVVGYGLVAYMILARIFVLTVAPILEYLDARKHRK